MRHKIHPIAKYIEDNLLTLADFAKQVRMDRSSISRFLNGAPMRRDSVHKIVKYTQGKISLDDLRPYVLSPPPSKE
jgi:predicted transcriptional regulator